MMILNSLVQKCPVMLLQQSRGYTFLDYRYDLTSLIINFTVFQIKPLTLANRKFEFISVLANPHLDYLINIVLHTCN